MFAELGFKSPLICPDCQSPLSDGDVELVCGNNHHFDIARQGYVNLLPAKARNSKSPGDTAEMVQSRRNIFDAGFYAPHAKSIVAAVAANVSGPRSLIADVGSGEGYYSDLVRASTDDALIVGLDISKPAVRMASSRYKQSRFVVGSARALPFGTGSVDLLLNVFSPIEPDEIRRVLKPEGVAVLAGPGANHLAAVRELVYDEVVDHQSIRASADLNAFTIESTAITEATHELTRDQFVDLIRMTPYWWHAREAVAILEAGTYEVTSSFEVVVARVKA